jgi:RNA 2',3'-cyclic 3'-phosphodiesterase
VRLFLGCRVGLAVTDAASALSAELRSRAERLAPRARLAWVPPQRFHVTVLFIGRVGHEQGAAVRDAIESAFSQPSFEAVCRGAGVFPSAGPPRVVWAGLADADNAFAALSREARQRLSALVPLEPERPARPHVTLARVKHAAGLRSRPFLEGLDTLELGTVSIDHVTLFESRPAADGVDYVALQQFPLHRGRGRARPGCQ